MHFCWFFGFFSEGGNWHFIYLGVCYDSGLTDTTLSKLSLFPNGRDFNLIAPYHPTPEPRASSSAAASSSSAGTLPCFPIPAWLRAQPRRDSGSWEPGRTHGHQICLCQPLLGVPDPRKSWGAGNVKRRVKPQRWEGGSCSNNDTGLGKMRCEIPGYTAVSPDSSLARCCSWRRAREGDAPPGGVWGSLAQELVLAQVVVGGHGCGVPPPHPLCLPSAVGIVTGPWRSEFGYFKYPKLFPLKTKLLKN